MKNEVQCLNPTFIVNPLLPSLLGRYGNYTLGDGYLHHIKSRASYSYYGNMSVFSRVLAPRCMQDGTFCRLVTHENVDDYYVLDEKTGETWPIFLEVPCGHCDFCKSRKMDAFSHRCLLESQCYDCLPWFTTLTYKPSKLPESGLEVRDVQLFLKRFRIRLDRMGYTRDFRYVCVGEYGSNTHRPHYHLLVWNIKPEKGFPYFMLLRAMRRSWKNGFIKNCIVSPEYTASHHGKPEKCFEYVGKYISKDCEVPEGKNPVFMCQSTGHGGIGSPFIRQHSLYLRQSLNKDFKFVDRFSGKVRRLQFNSYVIDRLFPSISRSVPYRLRSSARDLCKASSLLGHSYRFDEILHYKKLYGEHVYFGLFPFESVPDQMKMAVMLCPGLQASLRLIVDFCLDYISRFQDFDFDKARRLAGSRTVFLFRLFEHAVPKDLRTKAYLWRLHRDKARQRELL